MIKKIFLFGNIGNLAELPKSGGQTSCRRVMKGLQNEGFEVIPIIRHMAELESWWGHKIEVLSFALIDLFKLMWKLHGQNRKSTFFFQLTFSGSLVPYEYVLTSVVKWMGFRCGMYLQGGQFMDAYNYGSNFSK